LTEHAGAKQQASKAGIAFTALSDGFGSTTDPAGLQAICDRLGPGTITVFLERWWARLPLPLGPADRAQRVLVGDLDASGRGQPHPGVRRPPVRPGGRFWPGAPTGHHRNQPRVQLSGSRHTDAIGARAAAAAERSRSRPERGT
jgi:hypothetical protein